MQLLKPPAAMAPLDFRVYSAVTNYLDPYHDFMMKAKIFQRHRRTSVMMCKDTTYYLISVLYKNVFCVSAVLFKLHSVVNISFKNLNPLENLIKSFFP